MKILTWAGEQRHEVGNASSDLRHFRCRLMRQRRLALDHAPGQHLVEAVLMLDEDVEVVERAEEAVRALKAVGTVHAFDVFGEEVQRILLELPVAVRAHHEVPSVFRL